MIRSMTGFGRAAGTMGDRFTLTVTAKTVNHKYLEVSPRLPEFLWELEPMVRSLAAEHFTRGKLDVTIRAQRISEPDYLVRVNRKVADAVVPQLSALLNEFGFESRFAPADLLRVPDLLQVETTDRELEDRERDDFREIVKRAFEQVTVMRNIEGVALKVDIESRLETIAKTRQKVAELRETVIAESIESYRQRVDEISKVAGITINEDRIAQETVLLVERGDVAEELTRMTSHLEQIATVVNGKEPAGKRLDFLSQELLREINTLGSKSRSSALRNAVVELKLEVERIREQVQNVE